MRRLAALLIFVPIFVASCGSTPDSAVGSESPRESQTDQIYQPPFGSKEPEKYQAEIVFGFKFDEAAPNFNERTTFVARDRGNRRFDFEIGEGRRLSKLETADGKRFLLVPQRKIYAEIANATSENLIAAPEEYPLAHFLHAAPPEANFQKAGAEIVDGKQLTKYLVDFGAARQPENGQTETAIWIDENSGLPVKTEITALIDKKPSGAKSIVELRNFKTEVEPRIFAVPPDFRRISVKEIQEIINPK